MGKSSLDFHYQYEYRLQQPINPYDYQKLGARSVRKVASEMTGFWKPRVHSDVDTRQECRNSVTQATFLFYQSLIILPAYHHVVYIHNLSPTENIIPHYKTFWNGACIIKIVVCLYLFSLFNIMRGVSQSFLPLIIARIWVPSIVPYTSTWWGQWTVIVESSNLFYPVAHCTITKS